MVIFVLAVSGLVWAPYEIRVTLHVCRLVSAMKHGVASGFTEIQVTPSGASI